MRLYVTTIMLAMVATGTAAAGETVVQTRADVYTDEWIDVVLYGLDASHEGEKLSIDAGYSVDVLSGATQVFTTDSITSATTFSESRHQLNLSTSYAPSEVMLGGIFYVGSTEPDFNSNALGTNGTVELFDRMSTLSLSYGVSLDNLGTVHDPDSWERSTTHQINASWIQIVTRSTAATVLLTGSSSQCGEILGCLANPYRSVPIAGDNGIIQVIPEHNPEELQRAAAALRISQAFGPSSAIHAGYRFYADTWQVTGHTIDGTFAQSLVDDSTILHLLSRYSSQAEASFYRDNYSTNPEASIIPTYRTVDRELSGLSSTQIGGRVEYKFDTLKSLSGLSVNARLSRIWYRYPNYTELPERNAWFGGGGISASF